MERSSYRGIPCPACKRKGLSIANHPHALGRKDLSRVKCKYCNKKFDRVKLNAIIDADIEK
jgi:transposase-like protein